MSNTEHSGGAAHRSFRCTFGPVREVDLVWPPPQEDVDAFTVVRLDGGDAEPAPVEARDEEPVVPEPIRLKPRRIKTTFGDCRPLGAAPRVRPLVVPMEPPRPVEPALPDTLVAATAEVAAPGPLHALDATPIDAAPVATPTGELPEDPRVAAAEIPPPLLLPRSTARPADAQATNATRSVWLAVFFAAACAAVMFVEGPAPTHSDAVEAPPTPPDITVAVTPAPAPAPPKPAAERPRPAAGPTVVAEAKPLLPERAPKPAAAPAPRSEPPARLAVATPRRDLEPPPPVTPRVSVDVHDRGAVPAPTPPSIATSAPVPAPAPPPAAAPSLAAARPEPLASAPASSPVAAVLRDTANDEDDIRSTLTRFRTAYSKLDASAARDVWPSVDARALERAFQSLKSQDLHFDSCTMTVTGARAQAACKGRMVYVPRIGDQSPRFASREWNFELRKADERWTIASARSL